MCSTFWCTFLAALTRNPNLLLLVPAVATAVVEVAASEAISGATQLLMMKNARSKNVNTVQQGIGATTAAAATKNALAICGGSTMAVAIRYHDDDDCVPTKARNNAVAAIFVVMCRCCDVLLHVTRSLFVMIEPHQITL